MHIIFDVKQQDLRHKARLVAGGYAVDSKQYTMYSSNINDLSVRLIILISEKNGLGILTRYIGNTLCTASCAENIWSCCGAKFGPRCGEILFLKQDLYGVKTTSNLFHQRLSQRHIIYTIQIRPRHLDLQIWQL